MLPSPLEKGRGISGQIFYSNLFMIHTTISNETFIQINISSRFSSNSEAFASRYMTVWNLSSWSPISAGLTTKTERSSHSIPTLISHAAYLDRTGNCGIASELPENPEEIFHRCPNIPPHNSVSRLFMEWKNVYPVERARKYDAE